VADRLTLDSSVIVAFLNKRDTLFNDTERFIQGVPIGKYDVVIPTIVVCEVANVLSRNATPMAVSGVMSYLEAFHWVSLDREETLSLTSHFSKYKLKTSDAIVAGTALRYRATLISWDEKLLRESRKHFTSFTPTEFLKKIRS